MSHYHHQKRGATHSFLAMGTLFLLGVAFHSMAAESPNKAGLDEFLRKLRYKPLVLRSVNDTSLMAPAKINDGEELRLLVDTGWTFMSLREDYAKRLKTIGELGVKLQDSFLGEHTKPDTLLVEKLTLGGMEFHNQPARVREITMQRRQVIFDGALGWDFCQRNHAILDCGTQILYLRGDPLPDQHAQVLEESLRKSGFQEAVCGSVSLTSIETVIGDKKITLLVDTGADFTTLHEWVAKELGLKPIKHSRPATGSLIQAEMTDETTGIGDIGSHTVWYTQLPSFQLGPRKWGKTPVAVGDLTAWGFEKSMDHTKEVQGLLGIDFLSKNGVLIDFNRERLWLRPEEKDKGGSKEKNKK